MLLLHKAGHVSIGNILQDPFQRIRNSSGCREAGDQAGLRCRSAGKDVLRQRDGPAGRKNIRNRLSRCRPPPAAPAPRCLVCKKLLTVVQIAPERNLSGKPPGLVFYPLVFFWSVGDPAEDESFALGKDVEDGNEEAWVRGDAFLDLCRP
jgi:hypothetical protein